MKEIPLTQGYIALVDDADFEQVSSFKWYPRIQHLKCRRLVYAQSNIKVDGKWRGITMHRLIRGGADRIDHHDTNGLNNQRYNLRSATQAQNQWNQMPSKDRHYKGVYRHSGKWQAVITKNGVRHHLGTFWEECNAALAYNLKADELFGEFAYFNIPFYTPKEIPCNS